MPVRHHNWIAHFGDRTPNDVAVVDLFGERRFTYAQSDARMTGKIHKATLHKIFATLSASDLAVAKAS